MIGRLAATSEFFIIPGAAKLLATLATRNERRGNCLQQRHQGAPVALEAARELELEQNHAHDGGRAPR